MKKQSLLYWFVAFVCATLIFTGCPQESDDDDTTPVYGELSYSEGTIFRVVEVSGGNAKLSARNGESFAEAEWFSIPAAPLAVLKAVYEPNAPGGTADSVEAGKTAVAYTAVLSAEVLPLFQFTMGAGGAIAKVEITGTALPAAVAYSASQTNLIVIDIGKPGVVNSGLPTFYIPVQGLGAEEGSYSHIRLRVNNGASLVVLADNSGYIEAAAAEKRGNPCPDGYFNGGCVEVMAGGKLRDGAFEGFPLGSNSVILNRYGSYLSVGPEPGSADITDGENGTQTSYNLYYAGYLLGPPAAEQAGKPRIVWDAAGNTADSYLEVRPGKIATDAKLTVKKSAALIYSVWFVGNASITIDAVADDGEWAGFGDGVHGLLSNETLGTSKYNFYANTTGTVITIASGNVFDKRFLTSDTQKNMEQSDIIAASDGDITIQGANTGESVDYVDASTGISGYLIPVPSDEGTD